MNARVQNTLAYLLPCFFYRSLTKEEEQWWLKLIPNKFDRYIAKLIVIPMIDRVMREIIVEND